MAAGAPSRSPLVSAVTGEPLPGVSLELSPQYLLLSPVLGIWDALAVLSVTQHIAVLCGVSSLFVLWRLFHFRATKPRGLLKGAALEALATALFAAGVLLFYVAGALIPRPMAKLHVADPEIVVVDFHSHTQSSHDGRRGFTAEDNRTWHWDAGFHLAYITDHDSVGAGVRAAMDNPLRAGEGTVLLPGREVVYRRQHVVVLGTRDPRAITLSADNGSGPFGADARCPQWPLLVQTIPADLSLVPFPLSDCPDGAGGVAAVELLNGAPRGLGQSDRERERILRIADTLDIAVVAASNLHGWGRTASGWSLLRIPGWRAMTPEHVGDRIEETIRDQGRDAVDVVAYRRPVRLREGMAVASLPLWFAVDLVTRLSRLERLVWLAWIMAGLGLTTRRRRRNRVQSAGSLRSPIRSAGASRVEQPNRPGTA